MGLLNVREVTIEREGLPIIRDVSLEAEAGAITVLLGSNGVGKTTLLEGISGIIPLRSGSVELDGVRIDQKAPYRRAKLGVGHVEQGRTVFPELTTEENLLAAGNRPDLTEVFDLFPALKTRRGVPGGRLSGGEQQMLVLGRAFLRKPKVLLLDELSLGLAPLVLEILMASVVRLAESGLAILLVEQFADLALDVGKTAYVLRAGKVVFKGPCSELRQTEGLLQSLYLGEVKSAVSEEAQA
ncbi:MAG: ABC transporter ATP-binding protein [Acidimicrobiales bacterium]